MREPSMTDFTAANEEPSAAVTRLTPRDEPTIRTGIVFALSPAADEKAITHPSLPDMPKTAAAGTRNTLIGFANRNVASSPP